MTNIFRIKKKRDVLITVPLLIIKQLPFNVGNDGFFYFFTAFEPDSSSFG